MLPYAVNKIARLFGRVYAATVSVHYLSFTKGDVAMKKTIAATLLVATLLSANAFAATQDISKKLPQPEGTKVIAAEPAEKETPAVKENKPGKEEKATSMDLVLILDKSGSMYGLEKDTIGGFNSMLDKQRESDLKVRVTTVMFNNNVTTVYERADLKEVKNITEKEYTPQGTTALLDAVGNTLSAMKALPDIDAKGNKVLVVITTDGKENASKEWSYNKVKKLISELQEKNFEFVFLGANIDAAKTAETIGIKKQNAVKYKNTSSGVKANFRAVNAMVADYARTGSMESANWKKEVEEDK